MSVYPIWWDDSITLYNRYENPVTQQITWYRTELGGCFVQSAKTVISGGQIIYDSDSTLIRIPENENYRSYDEWIAIPNVSQGEYFTLHAGDIIILKSVQDTISEYTKGQRSSDLIAKYKDLSLCLTISSLQDNTGIGRVCPHYAVRGE